jgi:hypothetical protein
MAREQEAKAKGDNPTKAKAKTKTPKKTGRPTEYKELYDDQARKLCARGFSDKELGEFFNVSEQTINAWKHAHPRFLESIKSGKEEHDTGLVENALLKRALGYEHDDVDIRVVNGALVKTPIKKMYPPDTKALEFWLKNRNPGRWRDKQIVSHDVEDESPLANLLAAVSGTPIKPKAD